MTGEDEISRGFTRSGKPSQDRPADILSREYIERELAKRKCHKVTEYSTAERWMTEKNFNVVVPKECDRQTFEEILKEIKQHDDKN